jgi:hypothetical protein
MAKQHNNGVPGNIYLNKKRWWWKVRLPGEDKPKARPLIPEGGTIATNVWRQA